MSQNFIQQAQKGYMHRQIGWLL